MNATSVGLPPTSPAAPSAVMLAMWANTLGVLLIAASWYAAGGERGVAEGVPWANVGALGCALAGAGNAAYLANARSRIGARARQLLASTPEQSSGTVQPGPRGAGDTALVVLDGHGRFVHRPSCALVSDKRTRPAAKAADLSEPCGWCRP